MRKGLWIVALCAVLALAVAGTAVAASSLTLSASKQTVQYPHGFKLFVGFPTQDPGNTAVILQRIAGESEWTTRSVDVTSSVCVRATKTAAYVADVNGEQSDPVTVTVSARLTPPTICRHRKSEAQVVKGKMSPAEDDATVTVTFFHKECSAPTTPTANECKRKKGGGSGGSQSTWVETESRVVTLVHGNDNWSKWSTDWTPPGKGQWKVVVSHEDVTHAFSSAASQSHQFKHHGRHGWH
jgi:hypothetical protein